MVHHKGRLDPGQGFVVDHNAVSARRAGLVVDHMLIFRFGETALWPDSGYLGPGIPGICGYRSLAQGGGRCFGCVAEQVHDTQRYNWWEVEL